MDDQPHKRSRVFKASERRAAQESEKPALPPGRLIADTPLTYPVKRLLTNGCPWITTVGHVRHTDDATLLRRRGIGPSTLAEIRQVLGPYVPGS